MRKFLFCFAFLYALVWANAQTVLFEDNFDSYEDFAISGVGDWTLTDLDLKNTFGFQGVDFPNTLVPKSFMVFNSTATMPPMETSSTSDWTAHSGAKAMTSFGATTGASNDWLISPAIQLGASGNNLSFWYKAADADYGEEQFNILISTTNTNTTSFTALGGTNTVAEPITWTEFTASLDAYAGQTVYIAVQCVSNDQFGFLVDDFKVTGEGGSSSGDDLLIIDLSVENQMKITSTTANASATVSGSSGTGYYFDGLFSNAGTQVIGTTTYIGTPTLAPSSATSNGVAYLYRKTGTDTGLNIYGYSTQTSTFTEGSQAFSGEAAWNVSAELYAQLITAPESGNLYFPADDVTDITSTGVLIGTYSVILPGGGTGDCDPVDVPYIQDFETAIAPAMPECTTTENAGTGSDWLTNTGTEYGFTGTHLRYRYNSTNAANAWFYTQGINLSASKSYKITYDYGGTSTIYSEKLKVAYGTSATSTGMSTVLADHPEVVNNTPLTNTVEFTPAADGVYYFGFNAYSDPDKFYLFVDNIKVEEVEGIGIEGCTNGTIYPSTTYTPACYGANLLITGAGYAGEYSNVNVTEGTEYTFSSSVTTDFITISNADASVVYATGTGSVTWTATGSEVVRFYTHLDEDCGTEQVGRSRMVKCGEPITFEDPEFSCFQGDGSESGVENGYGVNPLDVYRVADDFFVETDNAFTIKQIIINALSSSEVTEAIINIHKDNAGSPGEIVSTLTMAPTSSEDFATRFGMNFKRLTFDLETPIVLEEAGTYWLEPQMTNADATDVYWEVTTLGSTGAPVQTSNNSGTAWVPDDSGYNYNAVFYVAGDCGGGSSGGDELLVIDLTTANQVTITATDGTSGATIEGTTLTGFYMADFFEDAGTQAIGVTTAVGTPTLAPASVPTDNTPSIYRGGTDADPGLNVYGYSGTSTTTFTEGEVAFTGDATWGITPELYAAMLTAPETGDVYFPADDATDLTGSAIKIGTYKVILPPTNPGGDPCQQVFAGDPAYGIGMIKNTANNMIVANDFNVEENVKFNFNKLTFDFLADTYVPETADLYIYGGENGPQTLLETYDDIAVNATETGILAGLNRYTLEITLPADYELNTGKYWVAASINAPDTGLIAYWITYTYEDNGTEVTYQSIDGGATWGLTQTEVPVEGVMTVSGTCETLGASDMDVYQFSYYPNPVKDVLNINSQKEVQNISVHNMAGQTVMQNLRSNNGQVNMSSLSPGVYVFRVTLQGGQVETFKVIKK